MAKKVLLVDDDRDFSFITSKAVNSWQYECDVVYTAQEAIDYWKTKKADILVIDFKLPDMDGIALLKELRKNNVTAPALMFTAFPGSKIFRASDDLGIKKIILKLRIGKETESTLRGALEEVIGKAT